MNQILGFTDKLNTGTIIDINYLTNEDDNFYYGINEIIFLGDDEDLTTIQINDDVVTLPGNFVFNYTPIRLIKVIDTIKGVLINGYKSKKQLFGSLIYDNDFNNYVDKNFVHDYLY